MEEQKNEIKEAEKNVESGKSDQKPEVTSRSMLLWALGGVYLLYTGYRLCQGVLEGAEDSGWGFFVAGVFFIVVGIVLLFLSIKSYNAKIKREQEEKEASEAMNADAAGEDEYAVNESSSEMTGAAAVDSGEESEADSEVAPKKPMSIAERARLASALGDVEAADLAEGLERKD